MNLMLKVMVPDRVIVDEPISRLLADGGEGSFCIKPRHVDYVSALVPGILIYETDSGEERFVATDDGVLVKCAEQIMVCTHHGVVGNDLLTLRAAWDAHLASLDEQARAGRTALARLEVGVVRKFLEYREMQ